MIARYFDVAAFFGGGLNLLELPLSQMTIALRQANRIIDARNAANG